MTECQEEKTTSEERDSAPVRTPGYYVVQCPDAAPRHRLRLAEWDPGNESADADGWVHPRHGAAFVAPFAGEELVSPLLNMTIGADAGSAAEGLFRVRYRGSGGWTAAHRFSDGSWYHLAPFAAWPENIPPMEVGARIDMPDDTESDRASAYGYNAANPDPESSEREGTAELPPGFYVAQYKRANGSLTSQKVAIHFNGRWWHHRWQHVVPAKIALLDQVNIRSLIDAKKIARVAAIAFERDNSEAETYHLEPPRSPLKRVAHNLMVGAGVATGISIALFGAEAIRRKMQEKNQ